MTSGKVSLRECYEIQSDQFLDHIIVTVMNLCTFQHNCMHSGMHNIGTNMHCQSISEVY
jgi:hypothetical protein